MRTSYIRWHYDDDVRRFTKWTSLSSHWKLTCSCHDIAEQLLSWRIATPTHSLMIEITIFSLGVKQQTRTTRLVRSFLCHDENKLHSMPLWWWCPPLYTRTTRLVRSFLCHDENKLHSMPLWWWCPPLYTRTTRLVG
jgi:hypothetical protein